MKKAELANAIRNHIALGHVRSKTGLAFLPFFAEYLDSMDIPADKKYDFWQIDEYLPGIIVAAFETLRMSTDQYVVAYKEITLSHEVPNLLDVGIGYGLDQVVAISSIASEIAEITDRPHLRDKIEGYCMAQRTVLQQTFDKFSRRVYQKGLYTLVDKHGGQGMGGKFGRTELRSNAMAGRILFTFARPYGKGEIDVTFIGEEGDPLLLSAGNQSCHATLRQSLDMMDEVIEKWPLDKKLQQKAFRLNKHIKLDVVAAMDSVGAP